MECPSHKVKALVVLLIVSPFLYLLVKYLTKEPVVPDCGEREYVAEADTKTEIGLPGGILICKKCPDYTRGSFDRKACQPDVCRDR